MGKAEDYAIVFASNSLSSPASAYGHVALVEISSKDESVFKNKAYNFSALVAKEDKAKPLQYFYNGLSGEYKGSLKETSFYKLFRRYKDFENRSVYLLYLKLTEKEKVVFKNLIKDNINKEKPYYFLGYNCATDLNELLFDAGILNKKSPSVLSPPKFVRRLLKSDKVEQVYLISSLKKNLITTWRSFKKKQKRKLKKFISKDDYKETLLTSQEIQFLKHYISVPRNFLSKNNLWDDKFNWLISEEKKQGSLDMLTYHKPKNFNFQKKIDSVNLSNRRLHLGTYFSRSENVNAGETHFLNYSHTVLDRQRILGEHTSRSWLELGSIELIYKDKLDLNSLELFNFGSYQVYNLLFPSLSYESSVELQNNLKVLKTDIFTGAMIGTKALSVFLLPGFSYLANFEESESRLHLPIKLGFELNKRNFRFNIETYYSYRFKSEDFVHYFESFVNYKINNYTNLLLEIQTEQVGETIEKTDFNFKVGFVLIDF